MLHTLQIATWDSKNNGKCQNIEIVNACNCIQLVKVTGSRNPPGMRIGFLQVRVGSCVTTLDESVPAVAGFPNIETSLMLDHAAPLQSLGGQLLNWV